MKFIRQNLKILIVIISSLIFLIFLGLILSDNIQIFDEKIYNMFYKTEMLTNLMKIITILGESITMIIFCILSLLILKDKKYALGTVINVIIITIITQSLKFLIQRPRPIGINLIDIGGFSFPSGHTTSSVAFYGFIIYMIYREYENKKIKSILITSLTVLIILIGMSRIYLGIHYASDVISSYALATAYLIVFTLVFDKKTKKIVEETL